MTADFAMLGVGIDTSGLKSGIVDLNLVSKAAEKVERATMAMADRTAQAYAKIANENKRYADAADRARKASEGVFAGATHAARYAQSIDASTRSLTGLEAVAARATVEAEKLGEALSRVTSRDLRAMDIQAFGTELDRLRAKYNPVFAAIQKYKMEQADIRRAHAVGAISTAEMANAISRERQAALSSIAAIKGRTTALQEATTAAKAATVASERLAKVSSAHTTNLLFQMQDIGMMAAMGQAPHILALQQGTQVAGIFHQIGNGKQIVEALKGALVGLLNPISLATVGIIGLGAAAFQYFTSASDEVNSLDNALEQHEAAIRALKDAYGEAASGAKAYLGETKEMARALTLIASVKLQDRFNEEMRALVEGGELVVRGTEAIREEFDRLKVQLSQTVEAEPYERITAQMAELERQLQDVSVGTLQAADRFKPFEAEIARFAATVQQGMPDVVAFRNSIAARINAEPNNAALAMMADEILRLVEAAYGTQSAMRAASASLDSVGAAAGRNIGAVYNFTQALRDLGAMIPEVARAQKVQDDLTAAADRYHRGMADVTRELNAGGISFDQAIDAQGKLAGLYERARSEVTGLSAATKRLADVERQTALSGMSARDAAAARIRDEGEALVKSLREAGAAEDVVARATATMNQQLSQSAKHFDELAAKAGAKGAAKELESLEREMLAFVSAADKMAEQMFPGEYALREAYELMDLLDRFDGKLDDFQRKAVEHRIDLMFASANAGVRDLSQETQKAGKEMEKALQPVADLLYDLFAKPVKDMDDLLDRLADFGSQFAKQNLQSLFGGGPAAANDNYDPEMSGADAIRKSIEAGARKGTQEGSLAGTFAGLFQAMGMSQGGAQMAGGMASAGLGGFGMGYQSQDPLMGGLGGALSGAMSLGAVFPGIGHIAGAIIGGIAGAIGGILGKNKVKKEAQQELEKNRGAITSLLAIGEGTGIGEMTQLWRDYYDEVQEVTELAWKAGDMDLVKRVQSAFNQFFDRLYEDYQRSFDGMVESLRMGHGTSSPFVQAANEVTELRESLINLIADAEEMNRKHLELVGAAEDDWKVGRMADQIREMTEAAVDMARSFLLGAKELSAMESEVMRVDGAASALQITLEQLGKSAEEAAAIIEADTIQALDKLRRTFLSDVSLSMADLADMGFVAELVSAHDMYAMRLRDFAALGLDASLATQELNLRLAQIASQANLTDNQLRMLADAFPALSGGLLALIGSEGGTAQQALADAQAAVERAKADLRRAYEEEASALEATISRMQGFIRSLEDFKRSLRLDPNLSPLSPFDRLQEAQQQYQETIGKAMQGDQDAIGRIEDVSRQYLEEARAYYGSSEMYFRIFEEVESILDSVLATAGDQLTEAEQHLAALDTQIGQLIDLNEGVLSVSDAIAALAEAEIALSTAEQVATSTTNGLLQQILAQLSATGATGFDPRIAGLYQDLVGRAPDQAGHAFWLNHLDQGYTADQIRQLMMQSPEYTALQGFSAGGFTGFGGLNQIMGVVHGGEFVAHAEATRRWRPQLEAMNAGGNPFAGGNAELVAELRAVKAELAAIKAEMGRNTEVTASGAQAQVAATQEVSQTIEAGNREAKHNRLRKAS